ncbi:MAG TPA: 4a-hydroxytetrahydrobiopterin dehydratase [Bacteroidales bacterium]|nr:4a-hydroxytetrahydrobiopterin dehydratase [Bacteroidales bacterium]
MIPIIDIKIMKTETRTGLAEKKCVPCEGNVPALKKEEIDEFRKEISGEWEVLDNVKLRREFDFVNYRATIDFVNQVATIAEEEGHHPDLCVSYGKVIVELSTHAIKGLSENDFILAAKIETF